MTGAVRHGHLSRRTPGRPWLASLALPAALAALAAMATLAGSGRAWAKGTDCAFRSAESPLLNFGVLNPSQGLPVLQRATAPRGEALEAGDCTRGAQMRIQVEGGLHEAGGRLRMKHVSRQDTYLRYTVQVLPAVQRGPGNGRYLSFELVGRIESADIAAAPGGSYSDLLRISVLP